MAEITDPRDRHLMDPATYGAVTISTNRLRGLIATASAHGAKVIDVTNLRVTRGPVERIALSAVQANTHAMLSSGSGERFPVGDHDLIVLRFVADAQPYSIIYVEEYERSYPCIVDGHIVDRDGAIRSWLGDADASDHPMLYLA